MRDAFFQALTKAAAVDPRVILLTADLGYRIFDEFAEKFPQRFFNMGVAEANMVSVAAGLALEGMRPFIYSIAPFATTRCLEQIRNNLCNMRLPVVVTGVGGGYAYGFNGATHHGVDDIGVMRAMPGMTVVCPCDPRQTADAVKALLRSLRGPAYLRLNRAGEAVLPGTEGNFVLGRPSILRPGKKVALAACGSVAEEALGATEPLLQQGISPLVLAVHTVKPISGLKDCLERAEIELLVTIEEHGPCGGLFEAVSAHLYPQSLKPRLKGLHAPDRFLHVGGSQRSLRRKLGLDAAGIARAVIECLEV